MYGDPIETYSSTPFRVSAVEGGVLRISRYTLQTVNPQQNAWSRLQTACYQCHLPKWVYFWMHCFNWDLIQSRLSEERMRLRRFEKKDCRTFVWKPILDSKHHGIAVHITRSWATASRMMNSDPNMLGIWYVGKSAKEYGSKNLVAAFSWRDEKPWCGVWWYTESTRIVRNFWKPVKAMVGRKYVVSYVD